MKFLILFLIISCSKVSNNPITRLPEERTIIDRLETDGLYSENMDVMVAFLWPERITTDVQRGAVRALITASRRMQGIQEEYLKTKVELSKKWKMEECDCVLNSICDETPPEDSFEICSELEESVFSNERKLPTIYGILEEMKESIKVSGGEWIKTHTDYPERPVSTLSFAKSVIKLSVFGADESVGYSDVPFTLKRETGYDSFSTFFEDSQGRGEWSFDLSIQRTPETLKFQGKLFLKSGSVTREGIVFWMNPIII